MSVFYVRRPGWVPLNGEANSESSCGSNDGVERWVGQQSTYCLKTLAGSL